MAATTFNFSTGPATVPNVGTLSYNDLQFGPLFYTELHGVAVQDNARRTVKEMEYTLLVDGYVTLQTGNSTVAPQMGSLRDRLLQQGGILVYQGRGFDLLVDAAGVTSFGGAARDVSWGPVPTLIDFQTLGGGLSAKVKWAVVVRAYDGPLVGKAGLLQFNCETTVEYGEDYFSSLSVRGTMEIPLTRTKQSDRTLKTTVDDRRSELDTRIFAGIDLERFRVVRRVYNVSRDKRTLEFDVAVEEKPYMDLPPGFTVARGTYSVRPVRQGFGLVNWTCTLRATYTLRAGYPRRMAWWAFLALMRLRMNASQLGFVPNMNDRKNQQPGQVPNAAQFKNSPPAQKDIRGIWRALLSQQEGAQTPLARLMDFTVDEGLYLDSKNVSFSASWLLVTVFDRILTASGVWRKLPEETTDGTNLWAVTMANVSKSSSWLPNALDPTLDVIVDFGGP